MKKINSGIGSFFQGNGSIVELGPIFGEMTPKKPEQNETSGENDLTAAKAATFGYAYQYGNFTKDECEPLEEEISRLRAEFNKNSKYITVYIFSQSGV